MDKVINSLEHIWWRCQYRVVLALSGNAGATSAPSPHIAKRALMFLHQRPFSFIHVPALLLGYDYFLIWRITSTTLPSRYSTMQTTLSPVSMGLGTPVMDSASC